MSSLHISLYPIEARKKKKKEDGKYIIKIYTDFESYYKKNPNQTEAELSSVSVEHLNVEQMAAVQETHHTFFISKLEGTWVAITIIIIFTSPRNCNKLLESS